MGNNTSNLLGLINYSNTSQQKLPVKIANNVVCAAAGTSHSLYLESDGRLWGMGDNRYGQLGIGSYDIELYLQTYIKTVPGKMSNDAVMAIAAGTNRSSLFIKTDGSLWAAGNNSHGQLGLPLKATAFLDYQGRVTERVNAIAVGTVHSLFIEDDGSLWAMGSNSYGQLGNENLVERNTPPIPVTVAGKVIAIAAGTNHSLFIKEDGSLWRMPGLETYTPELIPDTGRVIAVSTRSAHSLFINENGSLWGWGANHSGQLGDGSYTSRTSPVHIADSVAAVTAGKNHSLFILHDGSLWAMGANMHGQLGDGTLESRNTPVYIADDVVAVDAGQSRTVFIKSDGSLWSMGRNEPFSGPLGVGTTDDYITTPAKVAENVATASAGWEYTLYITSNGEMWGVGLNSGGQLTGLSRYLVKSESLHVTIDPPAAGSAIGAGQYHPGDPATISATPQPGYYFHHWDGVELDDPTTNPLTLAMHHDRKLTAVFRRIVEYDAIDRELSPAAQNYTIHVTSDRSWTVESHLYWASVDPVAGSGNGVVTVTVAENRGASLRSGAISIGGWLHILIQAPAADTRWRTAGVRAAGWLSLDWFGWFIDTGDWIYHRERGWLYCTGDDTTSIHIHDPAQDIWCWTAAEIYPWTFAFYPVGGAWIAPE
jgi:alpha-tubulin suppressor-like RCC1 family protein